MSENLSPDKIVSMMTISFTSLFSEMIALNGQFRLGKASQRGVLVRETGLRGELPGAI